MLVALSALLPVVAVAAAVNAGTLLPLIAVPIAVLPGLVFAGYVLRVAEAGSRSEPAVPSFVDWSGMARGGLGLLVLTGWYLLPLVVVVVAGLAAVTGFSGDPGTLPDSPAGVSISVLATLGLGALYVVVLAYVWPAALATYAVTGRLRSALNPLRVGGVALSGRYLVGWVAGALLLAVPGTIAAALSSVLIGLPFLFYLLAVVASLVGRASGRQLDAGIAEELSPDHDGIPDSEPEAAVQTGRDLDVGADDPPDGGDAEPASAHGQTSTATGTATAGDAADPTAADSPTGTPGADADDGADEHADGVTTVADRADPTSEAAVGAGDASEPATAANGATGEATTGDTDPRDAAGAGADTGSDEEPETLDGYEVADEQDGETRLSDPSTALSSFEVGDDTEEASGGDDTEESAGAGRGSGGDLGSTPLRADDDETSDGADGGSGGDGFEWGRVDGES
jgi:hypothetical protein